jgi:hypothetical protein
VSVERVAASPVKIIGAKPRGETCDTQVWPYIEGRCLVRAAAAPAARPAETTGAAPAPVRTDSDDLARPRVASVHLQLPPLRREARSSPPASDAWSELVEEPAYRTPSRRAGRRGYRDERNWRRRHAFPFLFR